MVVIERINLTALMMMLSPRPFYRKRQKKPAKAPTPPRAAVIPIESAPRRPAPQERARLEALLDFSPHEIVNLRD